MGFKVVHLWLFLVNVCVLKSYIYDTNVRVLKLYIYDFFFVNLQNKVINLWEKVLHLQKENYYIHEKKES